MCNSGGITTSTNEFSASIWFKPQSAGTLMTFTGGGSETLRLDYTAPGMSVTLGGETFNQGVTLAPNEWYYATISVERVSQTQSQVCVFVDSSYDNNCFSARENAVWDPSVSNTVCLGGGTYEGLIKGIDIYDIPLTNEETLKRYNQGANCAGACDNCDLSGTCFSSCNNDEFDVGGVCTPCDSHCSSCFGPSFLQCFSCHTDLVDPPALDYEYSRTWCQFCGDGLISFTNKGEECDDGVDPTLLIPIGGDGCNENCTLEENWDCNPILTDFVGPTNCGFQCISGTNNHTFNASGSWMFNQKPCDDGNSVEHDGCTPHCTVETGWICDGGDLATPDTCTEICGDGFDWQTFPCDDGNVINGDGCDSNCQIEAGWECRFGDFPFPDLCNKPCVMIQDFDYGVYPCQDNNANPDDGCFECMVERGWECTHGYSGVGGVNGRRDNCTEVCGDSYSFFQVCDDGNVNYLFDTDGCTWKGCRIDREFRCEGGNEWKRADCQEICGNGIRWAQTFWNYRNQNQCDDGNRRPGDGCNEECILEGGWQCAGGTLNHPDICTPICGDWRHFDREFCDDGNTVNGDGCDENCFIEVGFECNSGSHRWRDYCNDICGDGRSIGYYACDDGNNFDGDGCSADCELEVGWQCTGGDDYTPDTCREVCGDGINQEEVECDDGNLLETDGCSAVCTIEVGYICSHPVMGKDKCIEKCGDGLQLGWYQCDDGNNINGDGCNENCMVEECWQCDGLSPTTCFIDPIDTIGYDETTLAKNQSMIEIKFNNSIALQEGFDQYKAITIEVVGPLAPYNVSWKVERLDFLLTGLFTKELVIHLDWMDTQILGLRNENLTVCLRNTSQIKHFRCNKYLETLNCWTFPLDGKEYPESYCQNLGTVKWGSFLVLGQIFLGIMFAVGGYSAGSAWNTVYMLQIVHLIPVMSLAMPSCALYFFKYYRYFNFEDESLGGLVRNTMCDNGIYPDGVESPTYNFDKVGFPTRQFMLNMSGTFVMIVIISVLIPLISMVRLIFPATTFLMEADNFIRGRFIVLLVNLTYFKIAFLASLNFAFIDHQTQQSAFSSFSSVLMMVYLILVPSFYLFHIAIFWRELKYIRKLKKNEIEEEGIENAKEKSDELERGFRRQVLFQDFHTDEIWQYGYILVFLVTRLAYGVILSMRWDSVDQQLFSLAFIATFSMFYLGFFRPFRYPYRNVLGALVELGLIYILTSVSIWARNDLVCDAQWREFTKPFAENFTIFLVLQAALWLTLQLSSLMQSHPMTMRPPPPKAKPQDEVVNPVDNKKVLQEPQFQTKGDRMDTDAPLISDRKNTELLPTDRPATERPLQKAEKPNQKKESSNISNLQSKSQFDVEESEEDDEEESAELSEDNDSDHQKSKKSKSKIKDQLYSVSD